MQTPKAALRQKIAANVTAALGVGLTEWFAYVVWPPAAILTGAVFALVIAWRLSQ